VSLTVRRNQASARGSCHDETPPAFMASRIPAPKAKNQPPADVLWSAHAYVIKYKTIVHRQAQGEISAERAEQEQKPINSQLTQISQQQAESYCNSLYQRFRWHAKQQVLPQGTSAMTPDVANHYHADIARRVFSGEFTHAEGLSHHDFYLNCVAHALHRDLLAVDNRLANREITPMQAEEERKLLAHTYKTSFAQLKPKVTSLHQSATLDEVHKMLGKPQQSHQSPQFMRMMAPTPPPERQRGASSRQPRLNTNHATFNAGDWVFPTRRR
jgi:hypothetical protein